MSLIDGVCNSLTTVTTGGSCACGDALGPDARIGRKRASSSVKGMLIPV